MTSFREVLCNAKVYCFDGGYGTLLQARGLPAGVSPELWALERPDVLRSAHADYKAAGARILTTNTFGGSGPKLGSGVDVADFNRTMAAAAREVAGGEAFVAGSVGPTGLFVEPLGELSFKELVEIFKVQIRGLAEGGADLIKAETHFDLAEVKAAVVAAREVCDLPVMALMTFESAASLTGTAPAVFVQTMANLGVEAVGVNCSAGPEEMLRTVREMATVLDVPLHVQPNAGLPELVGEETVFRLQPEPFAEHSKAFLPYGAKFFGGCCGTTPEHIRVLARALGGESWQRPVPDNPAATALTTRMSAVGLGGGAPFVVVGERINPTGKSRLTEELQAGEFGYAKMLATEQLELGAKVLDVNVGAPLVDEKDILPALVKSLSEHTGAPLCLDSSDSEAVERALWLAPGSPLVNSISGEPGRLERLGPVCKKLGAPFILLPLSGKKLPVSAAERIKVIEEMLATAEAMGIPRRLIVVDALVLTVSSKPEAARACLEVVRHCTTLGLPTTMGLSNVSFGLPARELVNATFLAMCQGAGLSSCIANPSSARLREALAAGEVLMGRDKNAAGFIEGYAEWSAGEGAVVSGPAKAASRIETPAQAVVAGEREMIEDLLRAELDKGADPFDLVRGQLIPGIMEVGEKYEKKEYFLPQLMRSAETMQTGVALLQPLLEVDGKREKMPVVVMATVEGDIHDIGKNIVCLLLKNHGFEVVDLGKDVAAKRIVDEAERAGADLIGLSALMTTTMVKMGEVVELVRERGLSVKVMIGGAVVTKQFCESIGANGAARDAVAAVKLASRLAGRAADA